MKPVCRVAWMMGAVWWAGSGVAQAACQATPSLLVERVMSAACETCWSAPAAWAPPAGALVLDWVAPAQEDAAMQAVALTEAQGRWPEPSVSAGATAYRVWPLPRSPLNPSLVVQDGPGWNGYIAVSWRITRPMRSAAIDWSVWSAHAALVEQVPAGSEGTAVERQLVRAVVGPLPLGLLATQSTLTHWQALRLPESGQSTRWKVVGWLTQGGEPRVAQWAGKPACAR